MLPRSAGTQRPPTAGAGGEDPGTRSLPFASGRATLLETRKGLSVITSLVIEMSSHYALRLNDAILDANCNGNR